MCKVIRTIMSEYNKGLFQKKSTPPRQKAWFFDPPCPHLPGFPKLLEPPSPQDF